ncbi:MAG TPA: SDR family NAD(P)-dependent oxidoreductase [Acholeplasmataceae bacterium]|jgi:NAD(P)-dependent dehydrogenase (short-subunit alcohol dehydrogenase family)|nr:SDR family NAD(P)-dependent oxidoreductase [Acholeplasmataceae bacterium]
MYIDLRNKVVIITGGCGGLGSALTRKLIDEEATVIVNYLHENEAKRKMKSELRQYENRLLH